MTRKPVPAVKSWAEAMEIWRQQPRPAARRPRKRRRYPGRRVIGAAWLALAARDAEMQRNISEIVAAAIVGHGHGHTGRDDRGMTRMEAALCRGKRG